MSDALQVLEILKQMYVGKKLTLFTSEHSPRILPIGEYDIVKVFAQGDPGAEYFGMVYNSIAMSDDIMDEMEFDFYDMLSFMEENAEKFLSTIKKDIALSFIEEKEYHYWRKTFHHRMPIFD